MMKDIIKTIFAGIAGLIALCFFLYLLLEFCYYIGVFFITRWFPDNALQPQLFGMCVFLAILVLFIMVWAIGLIVRSQFEAD